jgi:hypothetical protein
MSSGQFVEVVGELDSSTPDAANGRERGRLENRHETGHGLAVGRDHDVLA